MSEPPAKNDPFAHVPRHGRERARLVNTEFRIGAARSCQGHLASVEDEIRKAGYQNSSEFFSAALARSMSFEGFFQFIRMFHFSPNFANMQLVDLGLRRILRIANR